MVFFSRRKTQNGNCFKMRCATAQDARHSIRSTRETPEKRRKDMGRKRTRLSLKINSAGGGEKRRKRTFLRPSVPPQSSVWSMHVSSTTTTAAVRKEESPPPLIHPRPFSVFVFSNLPNHKRRAGSGVLGGKRRRKVVACFPPSVANGGEKKKKRGLMKKKKPPPSFGSRTPRGIFFFSLPLPRV